MFTIKWLTPHRSQVLFLNSSHLPLLRVSYPLRFFCTVSAAVGHLLSSASAANFFTARFFFILHSMAKMSIPVSSSPHHLHVSSSDNVLQGKCRLHRYRITILPQSFLAEMALSWPAQMRQPWKEFPARSPVTMVDDSSNAAISWQSPHRGHEELPGGQLLPENPQQEGKGSYILRRPPRPNGQGGGAS